MADYLILRKDPDQTGPTSWSVVNLIRGKTADAEGATAALTESYDGPGKYGIVRVDNALTATVAATPTIVEDESPDF